MSDAQTCCEIPVSLFHHPGHGTKDVTLSLHLSNGPLLLCVVLYVGFGWRVVGHPKDSTRETRRRFRNGGEIYYLQHISYLVYQAHTLQLTHGISDNRTHENLRVTPRYKQHHSKQVIINRTRLQRCLAAWHIHYLTSTPSLSDGVPAIRSTNKN